MKLHPLAAFVAVVAPLALLLRCERSPAPPPSDDDDAGVRVRVPCFLGDKDAPPEAELVFRTPDGRVETVVDGGEVPLILPPQGGKVLIVGVRVKNMDTCNMLLNAAVRDVCPPGNILGREGRPVNLVPTGVSGFAEPEQPAELANYANIPVCPNIASRRDAHAEPYDLEVRVTDVDRRVVELRARVVPVCAEEASRAQCECECDSHFLTSLECPAILAAEDAPRDFDCPVLDGEGEEAEGEDAEGEEAE